MNGYLTQRLAEERVAELHQRAEQERLARSARRRHAAPRPAPGREAIILLWPRGSRAPSS
jgi:hypothetical protein